MDISTDAVVAAFTEAASTTFRESASTDIAPLGVSERAEPASGPGVSAELSMRFENGQSGCIVLTLSDEMAAAVAGRVLAGVAEIDSTLIEDCAGELINVIAGQAKTILSGTAEHFTISTPRVFNGEGYSIAVGSGVCQCLDFVSDLGPFVIRVYLG